MAEDVCALCLEPLELAGGGRCRQLECEHVFHEHCVNEMRRHGASGSCPMCRATSAGITTVQEMTNAAILHCMRGESWQALRLFQEILEVDGDNALAKYNLGVIYAQGEGVEQDFAKAAELFQQAHALGNSDATANLGVMYEQGLGVEQDLERAVELFREAHAAGDATATSNLGVIYEQGKGVEQDFGRAAELYKQAHAAGNTDATLNLGKLHERGKGVEQDFAKAITLYLQAHAAGNPDATFNLGVLYSADVDAQLGCVA